MTTIVTRAGKGAALTWTEGDANFNNLNTDKLENVVEDTSPQLGGNLDVNTYSIISASNGDIAITPNGTGSIVLDGQSWPQAAPATNGEYLTATAAGVLTWTDRVNAKTIYEQVKNVSGGSLSKGTPVYQIGVTGNTITVGLARADDPDKLAIGVLDETLADEAEGRMIVLGEIKGVDTSAFTTGDRVYLGATGGYTNTPPTNSAVARQFLGVVNRVDASNGSGYITGTFLEDSVKWTGTAFQFWDGDSWETLPYLSNIVEDTTPQLGGELDAQGNTISNVNLKDYKETNYALSYAATITPDVANGNVQTVTLSGNVTFNAFSNPESGQSLTLIVKQDATGSRTLTSTMKFAGAEKTLSTAANSIDIISVFYDGTTYYASLAKGFA